MTRPRLSSALLGLIALSTLGAAGCGGHGGGSARGASTAPTTSAAPSTALPHPGGRVVGLPAASTPVQATLDTDAYAAFQENASVSDLVIPAALPDRAFVVEDNGTVRVLNLAGPRPVLDRAIDLFGAPLQPGVATGSLTVQSASLALLTTSGAGGEGVALFDPTAAQGAADVTWFDLSGLTATWPAGTLNDQAVDVGGQALPLTYTAGAVIAGGRLIFCSSNYDASFDLNPGTVTAYAIDVASRTLSGAGALLQTSTFNPTALARLDTPQGELVLVTNAGPRGQPGSVDVIDPATLTLVGTVAFPAAGVDPYGEVVISPDGERGYLASLSEDRVYILDLEGLGARVGASTSADLSARFLGGYTLGGTAPTHYVSSIALSHTGDFLYAIDFNESSLAVVDLTRPELGAKVSGFARSGSPAGFQGLASVLAVRPGVPGVDYQGPSVYVMTINLAPADQTITNVTVALDTVTLDAH